MNYVQWCVNRLFVSQLASNKNYQLKIKKNLKTILNRKELYIVMDRSDLANRMKNYEKVSKTVLMKRMPVAIRL